MINFYELPHPSPKILVHLWLKTGGFWNVWFIHLTYIVFISCKKCLTTQLLCQLKSRPKVASRYCIINANNSVTLKQTQNLGQMKSQIPPKSAEYTLNITTPSGVSLNQEWHGVNGWLVVGVPSQSAIQGLPGLSTFYQLLIKEWTATNFSLVYWSLYTKQLFSGEMLRLAYCIQVDASS